jgi:hypothetical protein
LISSFLITTTSTFRKQVSRNEYGPEMDQGSFLRGVYCSQAYPCSMLAGGSAVALLTAQVDIASPTRGRSLRRQAMEILEQQLLWTPAKPLYMLISSHFNIAHHIPNHTWKHLDPSSPWTRRGSRGNHPSCPKRKWQSEIWLLAGPCLLHPVSSGSGEEAGLFT